MADETKPEDIAVKSPSKISPKKTDDAKSPVKTKENVPPASPENKEKDIETLKKETNQKFLQGKRLFLIKDYPAAVTCFVDVCESMSKLYGEQADELGDPYFYYGKALFELARSESQVLGDKVDPNQPEDDDDDDEDNDEDEEQDENPETPEEEKTEEKNGENKEGEEDKNGVQENKNGDEENKNGKGENEEEAEEDVNDLQLSWELFELARSIFQRKSDDCKESAVKLSEVYLCLGENGLESESYATAIEDIKCCLELQRKHLAKDDRRIAETYYQLGVAHSLDKNFDESIDCFKAAIKQLELKVTTLEENKEIEEKTKQDEVDDIKSVINEIHDKISDMLDYKEQMREEILKQVAGATSNTADGASTSAGSSSSFTPATIETKPISNITHLVRKKRKTDEGEGNDEKKTKAE